MVRLRSQRQEGDRLADLPGLSVRKDPKLGEIVVDKNGMTVYRFMKDQAWPDPMSACTGACLEKWPAVAPVDSDDTKGVQKKGLMGFTRPDGVEADDGQLLADLHLLR